MTTSIAETIADPPRTPTYINPVTFPPSPPCTAEPSRKSSVDRSPVSELKPYPLPPRIAPKDVLPEDIRTPDSHVKRDHRLIRLTGVHPFNVEAPLTELFDEGFLTSENLHYVRNHGHVPQCADDDVLDWTFTVEGMVAEPFTISVRDLIHDYEQHTYPITLVCAGNRRKEQNVVRKTKGFSWGAAGLSTALWTGVPIGDLLAKAKPLRKARYVSFEGADKLPNGYYGTSVKLNWCLDQNRGIMVAHKMNGQSLHPDHGKPVRIVVPGQIGGRSVKWLKKIIIASEPSDNWYHIYDNRVLPTSITPEASANLPDIWKDERYAIYDLNANSAICYPAHDESLDLKESPGNYKVRGYSYAGGGKRITRMEITLDKGVTWKPATMHYPEDDYRGAAAGDMLYGGKVDMTWRESTFCWSFWDAEIPVEDLAQADDIMVRAMDEGMMVQPRDMYWSVLGMMNNPWFRVVIQKEGSVLRFEHPTQPALIAGGWMERVKKGGGNLSNGFWGELQSGNNATPPAQEPEKEICMINPKINRMISPDVVRAHDDEPEPWFVVNGQVYDGTPFLKQHPGGAASIFGAAGQDATEEFMTIHSENAKAMMPQYHIGTLSGVLSSSVTISNPTRETFLQPKQWSQATLESKVVVSGDSKVFTFRLDHPTQAIGLPTGQHLLVRLRDPATREAIIRAYTPISDIAEKGRLRVLVKIYKAGHGRNVGGRMTQALDSIPLGHFVDFKGPVGKFEYHDHGFCSIAGQKHHVRHLIMICAGSGITPIFQVFRAVMRNAEDQTQCLVIDGNRLEADILLKKELEELESTGAGKGRVLHTLTRPDRNWTGHRGRIDRVLLEREVGSYDPEKGALVLLCGPEPMERLVQDTLSSLGWSASSLIFF